MPQARPGSDLGKAPHACRDGGRLKLVWPRRRGSSRALKLYLGALASIISLSLSLSRSDQASADMYIVPAYGWPFRLARPPLAARRARGTGQEEGRKGRKGADRHSPTRTRRLVGFWLPRCQAAIHHRRISMEQKTGETLRNPPDSGADGGFGYLLALLCGRRRRGWWCRSCRPCPTPTGRRARILASGWASPSGWLLRPVSRAPILGRDGDFVRAARVAALGASASPGTYPGSPYSAYPKR